MHEIIYELNFFQLGYQLLVMDNNAIRKRVNNLPRHRQCLRAAKTLDENQSEPSAENQFKKKSGKHNRHASSWTVDQNQIRPKNPDFVETHK